MCFPACLCGAGDKALDFGPRGHRFDELCRELRFTKTLKKIEENQGKSKKTEKISKY
jgi:hypothetical protein